MRRIVRSMIRRSPSLRPTAAGVLLVGVLGMFMIGASGIDEREFLCEEAAASIEDCCGVVPQGMVCSYEEGCDGVTQVPSLTSEQSKCVLNMSCDAMLADGVCFVFTGGPRPEGFNEAVAMACFQ